MFYKRINGELSNYSLKNQGHLLSEESGRSLYEILNDEDDSELKSYITEVMTSPETYLSREQMVKIIHTMCGLNDSQYVFGNSWTSHVNREINFIPDNLYDPATKERLTLDLQEISELIDSRDLINKDTYRVILGKALSDAGLRKPLTVITGDESEWVKHDTKDNVEFNIRANNIIRLNGDNNQCYNTAGNKFTTDGFTWFYNQDSKVKINLPYRVPTTPNHIWLDKI